MANNLFDDKEFFLQYKAIRENANSYNNLVEQPAMRVLLPDIAGKAVLDLGCGFGISCVDFIRRGAASVVGVDISEKMLGVAKAENHHPKIAYINISIEDINALKPSFYLVYSSLTLHYIEDIAHIFSMANDLIEEGGVFLFSIEHPMVTAPIGKWEWIKDEQGTKTAQQIANYLEQGARHGNWAGGERITYHRPVSQLVNDLLDCGFAITRMVEPAPGAEALERAPHLYDELHRPSCIIIRAQKIHRLSPL